MHSPSVAAIMPQLFAPMDSNHFSNGNSCGMVVAERIWEIHMGAITAIPAAWDIELLYGTAVTAIGSRRKENFQPENFACSPFCRDESGREREPIVTVGFVDDSVWKHHRSASVREEFRK